MFVFYVNSNQSFMHVKMSNFVNKIKRSSMWITFLNGITYFEYEGKLVLNAMKWHE